MGSTETQGYNKARKGDLSKLRYVRGLRNRFLTKEIKVSWRADRERSDNTLEF